MDVGASIPPGTETLREEIASIPLAISSRRVSDVEFANASWTCGSKTISVKEAKALSACLAADHSASLWLLQMLPGNTFPLMQFKITIA